MQSLHNVLLPRAVGAFLPPRSALVARRVSRSFEANTARWVQRLDFSDLRGASEQQVERLAADLRGLESFEVEGTTDHPDWSTREAAERSVRVAGTVLKRCAGTLRRFCILAPSVLATQGLEGVNFYRTREVVTDLHNLMALVRAGATFPKCRGLAVHPDSSGKLLGTRLQRTRAFGFDPASEEERQRLEATLLQHFPKLHSLRTVGGVCLVPQGGPDSRLRSVALDEQSWTEELATSLDGMPQSVQELTLWLSWPEALDLAPLLALLRRRPSLTLRVVAGKVDASAELAQALEAQQLHVAALKMITVIESENTKDRALSWQQAAVVLNHTGKTDNTAGIKWNDMKERLNTRSDVCLFVSSKGTAPGPLQLDDQTAIGIVLRATGIHTLMMSIDATDPEHPAKHGTLPSPLPPNLHLPDLRRVLAQVSCSTTSVSLTVHLGKESAAADASSPARPSGSLLAGVSQGKQVKRLELDDIAVAGRPEGFRQLLECNRDLAAAATCVNVELRHPELAADDQLRLKAVQLAGSLLPGVQRLGVLRSMHVLQSTQQQKLIMPSLTKVVGALPGLREVDSDGCSEMVCRAVAESGLVDRVRVHM